MKNPITYSIFCLSKSEKYKLLPLILKKVLLLGFEKSEKQIT